MSALGDLLHSSTQLSEAAIDHLQALLRFAPEKTWIHAFTDGRDVSPTSAIRDLALLPQDQIATVIGRYYAMDRDGRWERTQRAFDALAALSPDVVVAGPGCAGGRARRYPLPRTVSISRSAPNGSSATRSRRTWTSTVRSSI